MSAVDATSPGSSSVSRPLKSGIATQRSVARVTMVLARRSERVTNRGPSVTNGPASVAPSSASGSPAQAGSWRSTGAMIPVIRTATRRRASSRLAIWTRTPTSTPRRSAADWVTTACVSAPPPTGQVPRIRRACPVRPSTKPKTARGASAASATRAYDSDRPETITVPAIEPRAWSSPRVTLSSVAGASAGVASKVTTIVAFDGSAAASARIAPCRAAVAG